MLIAICLDGKEIVHVEATPITDKLELQHVTTMLSSRENPEYEKVLRDLSGTILYKVEGTRLSPQDDAHLDKVMTVSPYRLFRFVRSFASTQVFGTRRCEAVVTVSETDVEGEPTEPSTNKVAKKKKNRGKWDDTEIKIKRLKDHRKKWMQTHNGKAPKWTVACEAVGIDPKTARTHAKELREHWEDKEY